MNAARIHRHEVLEVRQGQYSVVGIDRWGACLEHADQCEEIVSHGAVTRPHNDHDFRTDLQPELSRHLQADQDFVLSRLG